MLPVLSLLILILTAAAPANALAVTIIDADTSESMNVRISDHDPNRIRIADGYIATAVGPRNGRIAIEKDDKQGELFIRINANDPDKDKAFTLFLTDAEGRDYNILLRPANVTGKSIMVIRSHTRRQSDPGKRPIGVSAREARIKQLVRGIARGNAPHRCSIEDKDIKTLLWKGTDYRLRQTMQCGAFSVMRYLLINTSDKEIRLAEQEFYDDGVAAVSVARLHLNRAGAISLPPGKSTVVIIVREMEQ